jgi:hypothetical protein
MSDWMWIGAPILAVVLFWIFYSIGVLAAIFLCMENEK